MKQRNIIKRRGLLLITAGVIFLLTAHSGHAEEKTDNALKTDMTILSPITVTGKGLDESWGDQFTTRVIRPDSMIQSGQTNDITDLLKESQSILIQDSSYGKKVFLRGMEDQDMRILINGMPVGQMGKYYGRSFEWETIPVEAIEKIEVTKGVGPAEWGNTLAGTINIITKRGAEKSKTRLKGSYGRFYDRKTAVTNSGTYGSLDWFIGGSYHKRNDYLKNNDLEDSNGFLSGGIDLGDLGEIRLLGYRYHKNEGYVLDDRVAWNIWSDARGYAPGSDFNLDNTGGEITYLSGLVDIGISYSNQKRDSNPEKDAWINGDTSDYDSDFNTPAVKCRVHHTFGPHALSLGGEYTYGDADADWEYYNRGTAHIDFKQDLWGTFFEDSWDILPKLNLAIGIRYDDFRNRIKDSENNFHDHISDHQWSPRYTFTYNPLDGLSLYFTGGRVFKAPTMADQYRWYSNYNFISFAGRAVLRAYYGINQPPGAPASLIPQQYKDAWRSLIGRLKPVKGWDYEIGFRQATAKFAYQVNFFYQDVKDYINIYPVSYPPTYNVDNVEIRGVELSGKYMFCRRFEAEGSYTYEETQKHGDDLVEKMYGGENDLFNAPKHLLNVTLRARPLNGITCEWQTRYTGRRFAGGAPGVPPQMAENNPDYQPMTYLGGYTIHNLRLSYETDAIRGLNTGFLLAIENITNKKTWERLDYPAPGTVVYGGIQIEF